MGFDSIVEVLTLVETVDEAILLSAAVLAVAGARSTNLTVVSVVDFEGVVATGVAAVEVDATVDTFDVVTGVAAVEVGAAAVVATAEVAS